MVVCMIKFYDSVTDNPIVDAEVSMDGYVERTNLLGYITFDDLPVGDYEVSITHPTHKVNTPTGVGSLTIPDYPFYSTGVACGKKEEEIEIPEKAPEEIIVVPEEKEVVMPILPWYASWLAPIIEYIGLLTESVTNFFAPIFEPIGTFLSGLPEMAKGAWGGFIKGVPDLFNAFKNVGIRTSIDNVKGLMEGSPEWQKELGEVLDPMIVDLLKGYSTALDITTYEKSPLSGEDAIAALEDMKNRLLATAIANFGMHAAVESGSLGQFEFMAQIDPMVVSKFGMDTLISTATMKPIEKAVLIPAEYELNSRYQPLIPPYTDLINMVVKEVIPLKEFHVNMAKQGYSSTWASRIWDAHFIPPNYTQLLQAHYRGIIDRKELDRLSILVDLDPRYKNIWDAQIEVIPPYSELTNELVKEVIDLDTYTKYLGWHGFNPVWAKRIWDAHFVPPSLGDILTAWRRGLIEESRVDELMILVDLDPRFKDIFDTRKYVDPSLRTARYMFETKAIDVDGVTDIVRRQGYKPEDTKAMVEYLTKFQERRFRDRYLTALGMGVIQGAYTEDELTEAVLEAGYTKDVAYWMIETANARKRIMETKPVRAKPRLLSVPELKKAYIIDKINADTLRTELLVRGYEIGDVDILISLIDYDKHYAEEGRKVISLSVSQMLTAYRYNEMTRDELLMKLQLRGLALDEAETLIKTKEKQWGIGE